MHKYLKSLWARINRHLGKMWGCLVVFLRGWMRSDSWLGGMWRRAGVLGCAVVGGFILGQCVSPWLLYFFPESIYGGVRVIAGTVPLTLPTFFALWWFRTYDSRQQLQRANFETGVGHIASDTPIRIEIGTQILVEVSKVTSAFDSEIALTFIKRLKRFPETSDKNLALLRGGYTWSYAQHMLKWLFQDYQRRNKRHDLGGVELRYQEFADTTAKITICEMLEMHKDNFLDVNVAGCKDDLSNFLGQCNMAHKQWDAQKDGVKKLSKGSKKFPTLQILILRKDCNLDSQ